MSLPWLLPLLPLLLTLNNMLTIFIVSVAFLGGVYVGARWAKKLREVYNSISG